MIGGGDWARGPADPRRRCAARSRASRCAIRNPDAIRPWQHVLNPLSGYLLLAERLWDDRGATPTAWNFGPADARRAPGALDRRAPRRAVGRRARAGSRDAGDASARGATTCKLDSSKARARLGWAPRWDLERRAREHRRLVPRAARRRGHARVTPRPDPRLRGRAAAPAAPHDDAACRFCGAPLEHVFVDLGMSPLANSYLTRGAARPDGAVLSAARARLRRVLPRPARASSSRRSASSATTPTSRRTPTWLEHARRYVETMVERFGLGARAATWSRSRATTATCCSTSSSAASRCSASSRPPTSPRSAVEKRRSDAGRVLRRETARRARRATASAPTC